VTDWSVVRDHLALALAAAVPLEIARLRSLPEEERAREIKAHTGQAVAVLLAEHGDDLLFGGRHCADAFAALATGLACLAFTPGGVRFAGLHFCADHTQCRAAELREVA